MSQTPASPDVVAFLNARLDEAEAGANEVLAGNDRSRLAGLASTLWDEEDADARRMLREVAAKRAIVAWYADSIEASSLFREKLGTGTHMATAAESYLNAITAFAAIYSDHPDYRHEWALGDR